MAPTKKGFILTGRIADRKGQEIAMSQMIRTTQTAPTTPSLHLTARLELTPCPACAGRGSIACPQTVAVRTLGFNAVPALQPSTGHPIPCPACNGKKLVPNA